MNTAVFFEIVDSHFDCHTRTMRLPDSKGKNISGSSIYRRDRIKGLGEIRGLLIETSKVSVWTFFFYPCPELGMPVFAMEFVNLNNKKFIVALDTPSFSPLFAAGVAFQMLIKEASVGAFGANLENEGMPNWYKECASDHAIFFNSLEQDEFDSLFEKGLVVWKVFIAKAQEHASSTRIANQRLIEKHEESIRDYKKHHHQNSPGLPMMNSFFGENWTDKFLTEEFFS